MSHLTKKIPCTAIFILLVLSSGAWAATGDVTITSPNAGGIFYTSTGFYISGIYIMTEDNSPSGEQYGSPLCSNGHVRFTPAPWEPLWGQGTNAEARYSIDGVHRGSFVPIYAVIQYTRDGYPYVWSNFNTTLNFSANVSINGLDPNVAHTARIYLQDVWGYQCDGWSQAAYVLGDIFAQATLTFRICLDADSDKFATCDGDCNDNDASIYPGAPELCDGKDNNCNGEIDEGTGPCCNNPCCDNPDPCNQCGYGGGSAGAGGGGRGSGGGNGPEGPEGTVGGP